MMQQKKVSERTCWRCQHRRTSLPALTDSSSSLPEEDGVGEAALFARFVGRWSAAAAGESRR